MNRRAAVVGGILLLAAVLAYPIWHRPESPAAPASAAEPAGVGALGRVEPASRVRKLAQPGGFSVNRVERLLVAEGDRVAAGQLLAELSDAAQKDAAILQAQAAAAEAQATLLKIRAAGRPSEIAAQQARIASLAAQESISRRDADRAETLAPTGAGSRAVAERNRAAAARAAADKAEAEAQLETLTRARPEDVAVAEAQVRSAEAALQRARADAALSRVTAPIAGTILKIHAYPGDLVGADGLLEMADLERMDIVADVYETDVPRLRLDQKAQVIVPGDSRRYVASVRTIGWLVRRTVQAGSDPVAAVDARTVEVRLSLSEDGAVALRQRTNMQVQVAIEP